MRNLRLSIRDVPGPGRGPNGFRVRVVDADSGCTIGELPVRAAAIIVSAVDRRVLRVEVNEYPWEPSFPAAADAPAAAGPTTTAREEGDPHAQDPCV